MISRADQEAARKRVVVKRRRRRLNAAADDMLAALKGCRDMLRESAKQHRCRGDSGHATVCDLHAEAANKAIAKAKGEE